MIKITKRRTKEIMKKEFDRCMKDKSLEVSMTGSVENPTMKFEFLKNKEKNTWILLNH